MVENAKVVIIGSLRLGGKLGLLYVTQAVFKYVSCLCLLSAEIMGVSEPLCQASNVIVRVT